MPPHADSQRLGKARKTCLRPRIGSGKGQGMEGGGRSDHHDAPVAPPRHPLGQRRGHCGRCDEIDHSQPGDDACILHHSASRANIPQAGGEYGQVDRIGFVFCQHGVQGMFNIAKVERTHLYRCSGRLACLGQG